MRSLLIAASDDEPRLAAALLSEADAVVVDLAVAAERREAARKNAGRTLVDAAARPGGPLLIARLSPLDSGETDADLDAIGLSLPFAVMLPKTYGAPSVQQLSAKLALREALNAAEDGATRIVALIDTAEGLFAADSLRGSSARLVALAWDAEALAAAIGAEGPRDGGGALIAPLRTARDMTLFAAAAARVSAVDCPFVSPCGADALRAEAVAAHRLGFVAKLALDPAHAAVVNDAFASKNGVA